MVSLTVTDSWHIPWNVCSQLCPHLLCSLRVVPDQQRRNCAVLVWSASQGRRLVWNLITGDNYRCYSLSFIGHVLSVGSFLLFLHPWRPVSIVLAEHMGIRLINHPLPLPSPSVRWQAILLGIVIGHLYFFLTMKYPQEFGGRRLISTPQFL